MPMDKETLDEEMEDLFERLKEFAEIMNEEDIPDDEFDYSPIDNEEEDE
jgi:hypothetical protein